MYQDLRLKINKTQSLALTRCAGESDSRSEVHSLLRSQNIDYVRVLTQVPPIARRVVQRRPELKTTDSK